MKAAVVVGVVWLAVLVTACGQEQNLSPGQADASGEPASTAAVVASDAADDASTATAGHQPSTAEPDVLAASEWIDVTENLAGMTSYCGNLAFVSVRPDRDEILAGVAGQGLFVLRLDSSAWEPFGRGGVPLDHRATRSSMTLPIRVASGRAGSSASVRLLTRRRSTSIAPTMTGRPSSAWAARSRPTW